MKNNEMTIAIIEDEPEMAEGIRLNLEHEGFRTSVVGDGEKGLELIRSTEPSLVLLDLMLPGMDGLEVLRHVRGDRNLVPVLILTAKNQETDIVAGLEAGADDYVCKPFRLAELIARIQALVRRSLLNPSVAERQEKVVRLDETTVIDFQEYNIRRGEQVFPLSRFEAEILQYLIERRGSVVSRKDLLQDVWGYSILPQTRTVDNHMARIRKKVERDSNAPDWIVTVHGIGYRFNTEKP
jgi:two-component system, OmpR family, alkaline phosphatase synthesis response regulator PhoP